MKSVITIGNFSIYLFGIFISLGLLIGYMLTISEAKRRKFDIDLTSNFIFYTIISGLLGARLYYVIAFDLNYYLNNPYKIIAFRDGGLSIQGALIGGILFALVYSRTKKVNIWAFGDLLAPGLILGQAIGRIGCDVFGVEMKKNYFWGVNINGQLLHPAQIYEVILNFILFGIIWSNRKKVKYQGQLFFIYLIGFSINRFIVEFFRTNPIVFGRLSIAHVTSIFIIVLSIIFMKILGRNNENTRFKFDFSIKEIIKTFILIILSIAIYYSIWSI